MTTDTQIQGKRAELIVLGELMRLGAIPYTPWADVQGVDAVVSVESGRLLRIQVKARGFNEGTAPRRLFKVNKLEVSDDFFIVCVEAKGRDVDDAWVFPSKVFDAYASIEYNGVRSLNLDSGKRKYGLPLYEILCGFKNRWELITEYDSFKHLLDKPEDLEDVLTMQEALEAPEEETTTLDEYEHLRRTVPLQYWVYENYPNNKAMVHKGTCLFCNNGKGVRKGISNWNGQWHGPFDDKASAQNEARNTGRHDVRECSHCSP